MIRLEKPALSHQVVFETELNNPENTDFDYFFFKKSLNYESWIKDVNNTEDIPDGWVPCSFFFVFNENNELIGRVSIRHCLNQALLKRGGHIGYGVFPRYRKKNYGTEILKLALVYAKNLGLKYVLLDCDSTNIGSQKIIENNSGIKDYNFNDFYRYWIIL